MLESILLLNKIIVGGFDLYIITRVYRMIWREEKCRREWFVLPWLVTIVITTIMERFFRQGMNIIGIMLLVYFVVAFYKGRLRYKIMIPAGVAVCFLCAEGIVDFVSKMTNWSCYTNEMTVDYIELFLSRILVWIIVSTIAIRRCYSPVSKRFNLFFWIQIIVFLVLVIEMVYLCAQRKRNVFSDNLALIGAEVTIFLMIYLQECIFRLYKSDEACHLARREEEIYKRELLYLQQQQDKERQLRHDWNNKLEVLYSVLESEPSEKVYRYIEDMKQKAEALRVYSDSGNVIIDSVINAKLSTAELMGIRVNAEITIPENIQINEDDMVTILGNLLDNAVEANRRVKQQKEQFVQFRLNYVQGTLLISISNRYNPAVTSETNGIFDTSKEDKRNHGIGIQSVKNVLKNYHGEITFETSDDIFIVDALLYL